MSHLRHMNCHHLYIKMSLLEITDKTQQHDRMESTSARASLSTSRLPTPDT